MLNFDDLYKVANRVARNVAPGFPGVEAEDIAQEIMVHVLERKATFERGDYSESQLVNAFTGVAKQYAGRERYAFTFNSGQYVYTPDEIRAIFDKAFFNPTVRERMPKKEPGLVMDSTNDLLALLDIDTAFEKLGEADKTALRRRYEFGLEYADDAERKRVNRAIDKVTRALNNRVVMRDVERDDHDGPGARSTHTNAAAQAATGNDY